MFCTFLDHPGFIWFELLKHVETVGVPPYQPQLAKFPNALPEKLPEYQQRQH